MTRCYAKKDDEIEKLKKDIDEARSSITKVKASYAADIKNIHQEMSQKCTLLQNEQKRRKELEEEKRNIQGCLTKKDDEIEKCQKDIDEARSIITKVKASNDADIKNIHQEMSQKCTLLQNEQKRTKELEEEKKNIQRMRKKSEDDLAKLKMDNEDAKSEIKSLTDQHNNVKRKHAEDTDRLKFRLEFITRQVTMIPPATLIGMSVVQKSFQDLLMVVAIEIGTSYSGCCFSWKGTYAESRTDSIISPQFYTGEGLNLKQPTAVLFNPNREMKCFGYEAVKQYTLLEQEDDHHNWFYFTQFKTMLVRSQSKNSAIQMKTTDGRKELPAVLIYAMVIKYFKDEMIKCFKTGKVFEDEIGWIITLPPSATYEAQQLMIKAAKEAGILEEHLLVLSETDATVAVCRNKDVKPSISCSIKVLVMDLGCGSFDISVLEIQEDQSLKSLLNSSFPAIGWHNIKEAFEKIILDIVGNDIFQRFCNEHPEERKQWLERFFRKVCCHHEYLKEYVVVETPMVLQEIIQNKTDKLIDEMIRHSKYSDSLKCIGQDRLKIKMNVWNQLFDIPVQQITNYVKRVTEMEGFESLSNLIITGRIVESKTMQERLKQIFIDKNVIIPKDPEITVLKGAIVIGNYIFHRNDRDSSFLGGCVFTDIKSNLVSDKKVELVTECEVIWTTVKLQSMKDLYMASFHMPYRNMSDIVKLKESINKLADGNIYKEMIIAGDFNCPDIDSDTLIVKPGAQDREVQQALLDTSIDLGPTQVQRESTRYNNLLYLVFTNNPSVCKSSTSIPAGISGHAMVVTDFDIIPHY
ncbi:unnamed protein product [Mytilus coruscus]|uniref:Endonuclease/exonuclease/phosphatase domain-containing protein n=1 Tax=Mytilus coruscus TaxID=42192 RepID=A0A6J8E3K3_MYTCO|nr:unnamed protein product [Mytilus coruscus]